MHRWTAAAAVIALFGTAAIAGPPKEGSPAPDINLPATQAEKVLPDAKGTLKLSDLKGKKNVVLYFYPKAMTSGCTIESCGFRDLADKFAALDTVVIGISTDTLDDQKKFTDKESLNFPLIADSDKSATKAYGALNARNMASRYTFVIDKQGVIRKEYLQVNPKNHPQEVLNYVKENLTKG
ncbi:MAG TPA: peroxiredoxin [Gemmataceae bacterium]|nr:peroxiredoxin [Gemmataceae bacterium]